MQKKHEDLLFLDGLRGIAAIYVMVGHARWLLWEGYSHGFIKHPETYSRLNSFLVYFFSLFRYGHQATIFFFVLSGFLIHLKYSSRLSIQSKANFDYWSYLVKRIKRIYPPLFFAILLTFFLDYAGHSLGYSIYYQQTPNSDINQNIKYNLDGLTLLGNLFFLMNTYVPIWGSNGPLWSLKYEWWFYMTYPLLFFINRKSTWASLFVVVTLYIVSFIEGVWFFKLLQEIFAYLLSWWLGGVLADIYVKRLVIKKEVLSLFCLIIALYVVFYPSVLRNEIMNDTLIAFGFFGVLMFLFFLKERKYNLTALNRLKWLGDCSYTLYVTHFPILVFLSGWLLKQNSNLLPRTFEYVFLGIFITLGFAYVTHFLIEKPFLSNRRTMLIAERVANYR